MALSRVLFIGDSSLFCCRSKKKLWVDEIINKRGIPGLEVNISKHSGGDIKDFVKVDIAGYAKICVSYFGNDALKGWTEPVQAQKFQQWHTFLTNLRNTGSRVIFWVGGFSLKYGLKAIYDTQMDLVRSWIREAGFQVVTAFDKVAAWQMGDKMHAANSTQEELGDFWLQLLSDDPLPPEYFSQTRPKMALVFRGGSCEWIREAGFPAAAVEEEITAPEGHKAKQVTKHNKVMARLSQELSEIRQLHAMQQRTHAAPLQPQRTGHRGVPKEAGPVATTIVKVQEKTGIELSDHLAMAEGDARRVKKRWLRPKLDPVDQHAVGGGCRRWQRHAVGGGCRRWQRPKLDPVDQPKPEDQHAVGGGCRRWQRPRPAKPEGLTCEECWHFSNSQKTMIWFKSQEVIKEGEMRGFLQAFGSVKSLYLNVKWGWAEFVDRASADAVLEAYC